jgi:uncharacterized membrane protein YeaQ/YmgE (transglycosylase-associated protein family)
MDIQLILGWALIAICPPWWPWPRPWPPPPPWRLLVDSVIAIVGGVAGGWLFSQLYAVDLASDAGRLVSFAGALVGSILVSAVAGMIMPSRAAE